MCVLLFWFSRSISFENAIILRDYDWKLCGDLINELSFAPTTMAAFTSDQMRTMYEWMSGEEGPNLQFFVLACSPGASASMFGTFAHHVRGVADVLPMTSFVVDFVRSQTVADQVSEEVEEEDAVLRSAMVRGRTVVDLTVAAPAVVHQLPEDVDKDCTICGEPFGFTDESVDVDMTVEDGSKPVRMKCCGQVFMCLACSFNTDKKCPACNALRC